MAGAPAGAEDAARAASIGRAWRDVRARIAAAAARVGRDPASVRVVAVGKGFPAADLARGAAQGMGDFGENRVQEALPKIAALPGVRWHLIGQLQRNKARAAVGRFCLVHSLDRIELADSLQRAAEAAGCTQRVLLQVGLTDRPGQGGIAPALAADLLRGVRGHGLLLPVGLMTIAPAVDHPEGARPAFAALRALRARLQDEAGLALPELSMGMSHDFEVAVEEGATLVRVGRAIFGERAPVPSDEPAR